MALIGWSIILADMQCSEDIEQVMDVEDLVLVGNRQK